jgi:hypothetical protein
MGNDVVEEKTCCCVSDIVEGRHAWLLSLFGKVIYCHDDDNEG